MFKKFIQDPDSWEGFITGAAGTGKTTGLAEIVKHCQANDIAVIVCAFTHKACGILKDKLPADTDVKTLHSVLRKRPTINDLALKAKDIEKSRQHGKPDQYQLMLVDEFSQVGEQDYMDIGAMQDPTYDGEPVMKVIYIGDMNQLPPVGDIQTITPSGQYWHKLTRSRRLTGDSPLLGTLTDLVAMIEGGPTKALEPNKNFKRGKHIVKHFALKRIAYEEQGKLNEFDSVMLAFTNERVESLNAEIEGRNTPAHNDSLFSPTTRKHYIMDHFVDGSIVNSISKAFGDDELGLLSKYKTLEHLIVMTKQEEAIKFIQTHAMEDGEFETYACVFGHYQYKLLTDEYKQLAADSNAEIERVHKSRAKVWAAANPHDKLARARAKAWRDYLTFKECVICLDFPHAMTVHKSQGSTYQTVYIDTDDIHKCANRDFKLYLRLLYVAISRASDTVITN